VVGQLGRDQTTSLSAPKVFSFEEVEKHRTADDCWVIYKHKVYDVTDFLSSHPGGPDIILMNESPDVTDIMNDPIEHSHSASAFEMLDSYYIGDLEGNPLNDHRAEKIAPKFLDLTKPVWPQMWYCVFTKDFYMEQVHIPLHIKDGSPVPIFGNFLVPLTMTPWYIIPTIWVPFSMTWLYFASFHFSSTTLIVMFILGLFHWTLLEYIVHRFVFHIEGLLPDHPKMLALHFLSHGIHHHLPMDHYRLVMPPALFTILMVPVFCFYNSFVPTEICYGIGSGTIFGYVLYDMIHYYIHHGVPLFEYIRMLKTYHLNHHYLDWQQGFGITNVFWDKIFGTYLEMKK